MAKRVRARGRSIVFLGLVGFVLIAAGVVTRRVVGLQKGREILVAEQKLRDLQARRTALLSEIRDASAAQQIMPIAEGRLGMHVPSDSMLVWLPRPDGPRPLRDAAR